MGSGIGQRKRMKKRNFPLESSVSVANHRKVAGLYRIRHFSEILSYPRQVRAQLTDGFLPVQQHRHPVAVGIAPFRMFIHVPPLHVLGVLWPATEQYGCQLLAEVAAVAVVENRRVDQRSVFEAQREKQRAVATVDQHRHSALVPCLIDQFAQVPGVLHVHPVKHQHDVATVYARFLRRTR